MSVKFTILGCGYSFGVPRIDGSFGKCNPNNKKNYRIPLRWDIDELPINFPKQIRNIYERVYKENRKRRFLFL